MLKLLRSLIKEKVWYNCGTVTLTGYEKDVQGHIPYFVEKYIIILIITCLFCHILYRTHWQMLVFQELFQQMLCTWH